MIRPNSVARAPRRALTTRSALWVLMMVFLVGSLAGCFGCGDEVLETDPTLDEMMPPARDDIDDVEMGDQPFDGSGLDQGGAEGEAVEAIENALPQILLQDVFFEFDKFDLGDDARAALAQNGRLLREHPGVRVLIEGHCDERGTVQYNLALGEKRAREARRYLQDLGIGAGRVDVVSYGKERPFVMGHDEASWSQNRRAHFVLR